ncbi:hypothetical protein [Candidatus Formimonas warabiya]|uniref:hypothetical protein n=1 Tax=Formimonas warabiya TaxID=1761012 RepID=UPI001BE49934|nr:hypothetical protein [Candidatus Formimonas warabiya]
MTDAKLPSSYEILCRSSLIKKQTVSMAVFCYAAASLPAQKFPLNTRTKEFGLAGHRKMY